MILRLATEADLPRLAAVELSAAQSFRGTGVPEFILTDASPPDHWAPQQAAGTLWVAADDAGEVVGYLAATRAGAALHIDEFDVAQPAQGRGLGRRMLRHVTDWARAAGLAEVSLTTFRTIPWNGPFYASCGFAEWPGPFSAHVQAEMDRDAAKGLTDRCAMRLVL